MVVFLTNISLYLIIIKKERGCLNSKSDRHSRKSHTKNNMAEKRTSETTVPPELGHETKFLDSEDEGSTTLRN